MRVAAIVVAGGRGARIGGDVPKQFRRIGARTVLEHAVLPFARSERVTEVVVVLPPDPPEEAAAALRAIDPALRLAVGGARRQDSVAAGLSQVSAGADIVLVHDGARPFCSAALIARTVDAAAAWGAAVPALEASDTVKGVRRDGEALFVRATLPRDRVRLAQTPQAFRREVLAAAVALGQAGADATDEAGLAERAGHRVRVVAGEPGNIKITTPDDLTRAEARARSAAVPRIGLGYDSHRLAEGRALVLGGVVIPHPRGLVGHSDADAVCHAVTDALLGAAAAGDIGQHFPDTDPRWRGASSVELLARVAALVRGRGLAVGNVDVVVVAERPKLAPHVAAMRSALAAALGVDVGRVSVKAKTAEGLDAVGREEAVAVHAVALLVDRV
ncbi:MAG: 2-C-methyl-D-erythritol 4-phosphate cytidylyltransferase [Acidobacteria bacterium]|nr:2-C-methyl-D-erythritol 4-phosphate cytidylyltransferase [Acidobacteriota bacterium]